ncbi:UDP-N-acetylglucosamine--N-acetylmuramyl-(pentapeptide) pyrophosphoryl-undecaprenol N-acetylglucosamine transferase [Nocardioides sp. IC4_145]|uniref:UDP-N-acetylglucosamine--N-acetylmuramyl- (pentapeptide) pyrophosphoryl-undecaprenol N-acetylglucosamine transferase n=1 Tax=Nocardioides sp. IC4_145 TaxID=2714037 RepID=UPI00140E3A4C|nr:UDP-N-acetylglucosamine--N-acetylmuramyl-(pentapeptide) pyrophosphoryl-undecaprenol N-acetylglucosamine transferase [Nocardioides sp. IC4_145]NHC24562.1 UDP-N-acetylglucosamine--N-acetylmuramyl-(pentapeptide) pyrophosphoryl-undecaprenol N-acetylglucosamine transferase [Nocardioides sp. IC4_145]
MTGVGSGIGYYVHHVGRGHLHRAGSIAAELARGGVEVTGLSTLPEPAGWPSPWVQLARDDEGVDPARDAVTAGGRLHWVPRHAAGLRDRSAAISAWIGATAPRAMVVDVSVEVCLLARLHGVPVVSAVLPGVRDDAPHLLGADVADALLAFWPAEATARGMVRPAALADRVTAVGGLARYAVADPAPRRKGAPRVTYLAGSGGHDLDPVLLAEARRETPDWEWTVLGGTAPWVDDPRSAIAEADVVVTHAGQNALAEVAALRRPCVVVPQDRPHDEQHTTARVLDAGPWPAVARETFPVTGWAALLDEARGLDGAAWAGWCDGGAAARAAEVVRRVALGGTG